MNFNILSIPAYLVTLILSTALSILDVNSSIAQQLRFEQDNFSNRFPLVMVNEVFQDPNGLIWLGTTAGLYSYDGLNYHLVAESKSISISHIFTLNESEFLAGTEDGKLLKLNYHNEQAELISIDSVMTSITGVVTKNDQLYVASYGDGLWKLGQKGWQKVLGSSEYPYEEIYTMVKDDAGRIYLGTDDGVCIIRDDENQFDWITVEDGLPDNILKVMQADEAGNIWLGFHQNGFCKIVDGQLSNEVHLDNWEYGPVSSINTQLADFIFLGTTDGNLIEYHRDTQKIELMTFPENYKSAIKDIMVDREASLWISDSKNGLSKSSLFFSFLEFPQGISNKNVQSIFMDAAAHLWFTTADALYECSFTENNTPVFKKHLDAKVYGSSFISLYIEKNIVWIGTFGDGLLCYCPETGKVMNYREKNGLANNNILSIAANKETIWFATLGGVSEVQKKDFNASKFHEIEFKNYHEQDGLGNEYIYQVFVDSKGRPWFATDGKGLTMLEDGKFTNYSEKDGLNSRIIYSITEDENGHIWFATPKDGIYRFDGMSFHNYGENYGLLNYQISSIQAWKNSLVIIHKFGIDILKDNVLRSFNSTEGIGEINPDLNAKTVDMDGNIWIGHQTGIIKLNPSLKSNMLPEILISSVLVNLNPIEKLENTVLSHADNYLTFNYLGFWYADPLKIKYEYKLDGISKEWTSTRDHFVTFPNLPSGPYSFSVRASTNDNFENASIASYSFRIRTAYWESPWFYAFLVVALVLTFGSIIKIRERTLRKKSLLEREKIQFQFETLKSQINPHFLFNSFNTLISIIEEEPGRAGAYVEKLSDFFRNIIQLREKDVISLTEELELVKAYTFLQEKRFGKNINVVIDIPEKFAETQIPPLTIQLLAENAIKHNVVSKDRPLTLRIFIERNFIIIQNNINLKSKPEVSTNYGLENIIKRYQLLTKTPVEVIKDEKYFTIKLPIIQ